MPISIGKPLPNTTCYILDNDQQPLPIGEKGSMWVGGAGVSRGYINLKELTSQRYKPDKFLNDEYVSLSQDHGGCLTQSSSTMFNTGDIVRWRPDGSLEMFGRTDDQVKIKVRTSMI
jgi:non-ribosomal peptide synthetase component F